jgi:carboxyl-terminal processing protease
MRVNRRIAAVSVLFIALLAGGWMMRRGLAAPGTAPRLSVAQGQRLLDNVMQRVQSHFIDSLSVDSMYADAAVGLVGELGDPNSAYLPPDRLRRLREATSGSYRGVGMSVDVREGWITVLSMRTGLPAERGGLQVGDRLVEIDGQSMKRWTIDEARNALRGPLESTVKLVIVRGGGTRIPLTLARSDIHVSSVQRVMLLNNGVAFFAITSFSDSTALEVAEALDSLVHLGATSLVLDLRGNPGGLLSQGVAVADLFLDEGQKIVSTRGRVAAANATYLDTIPQRWPRLPMIVIVNSGTASAAEIVAGALQDHDRAVVMGRPSYGKGSAQQVLQLENGAALKVTNALWYTPVGRSIDRPHGTHDAAVLADSLRPKYKTDRGRTVVGGGGIVPDVVAGDSVISPVERAWVNAVGVKVPQFREALTAYAADIARRGLAKTPEFTVTPEMRQGLWSALVAAKVIVPRQVYDDASEAIDRVLGAEVARQAFGVPGAQQRSVHNDAMIARAATLLQGVTAPDALIKKISAKP